MLCVLILASLLKAAVVRLPRDNLEKWQEEICHNSQSGYRHQHLYQEGNSWSPRGHLKKQAEYYHWHHSQEEAAQSPCGHIVKHAGEGYYNHQLEY